MFIVKPSGVCRVVFHTLSNMLRAHLERELLLHMNVSLKKVDTYKFVIHSSQILVSNQLKKTTSG